MSNRFERAADADLAAWLWRIDQAMRLLVQRAAALSQDDLDWQPPDGDIEFSANLSLEQTLDPLCVRAFYGRAHRRLGLDQGT